jgi:hypothetical protein
MSAAVVNELSAEPTANDEVLKIAPNEIKLFACVILKNHPAPPDALVDYKPLL